jgi:hypothetical protein
VLWIKLHHVVADLLEHIDALQDFGEQISNDDNFSIPACESPLLLDTFTVGDLGHVHQLGKKINLV